MFGHILEEILNMLWANIFVKSNEKISALPKFYDSLKCSIALPVLISS
jgi:hypothetical protein